MNGKIDALTNDRSDRQATMMNLWQDSMVKNQQKLKEVPKTENESYNEIREKIRNGEIECPACKNRKYVDGSDDSGVSFQTPTTISPGQSKAAVLSHEREHVVRNRAEALAEGREVTHSSVSIEYDICPDCGRSYVAGGLTHTITQDAGNNKKNENTNPFEKALFDVRI